MQKYNIMKGSNIEANLALCSIVIVALMWQLMSHAGCQLNLFNFMDSSHLCGV
jgi:hypothetical protein